MKFYNRENELAKLNTIVEKSKSNAQFTYVVGRRRIGKTSLINSIGVALNRPVYRISLGGSNDANILNGHSFTYIGSKNGKIIDALINSKIMNCILHFDEIDKFVKKLMKLINLSIFENRSPDV